MQKNLPFEIRSYQPGDEHEIIDLLEKVFHYNMGLKKWRWLFEQNPDGSDILVAVDQGRIVGHQGRIIHRGTYFGKERIIEHPAESCLLPQYRGQKFMEKCLERYLNNHQLIAWSFNSWKMARVYSQLATKMTGDKYRCLIMSIPNFKKKLSYKKTAIQQSYSLEGVTDMRKVRSELDMLWAKKSPEIKVGLCRDFNYLNWKMGLTSKGSDRLFFIRHEGEIVGYVFLSRLYKKNITITDFLILNRHINKDLIGIIEKKCRKSGASTVDIVATDQVMASQLKSCHYKRSHKRYFNCYDQLGLITPDSLYLTFSDYWL